MRRAASFAEPLEIRGRTKFSNLENRRKIFPIVGKRGGWRMGGGDGGSQGVRPPPPLPAEIGRGFPRGGRGGYNRDLDAEWRGIRIHDHGRKDGNEGEQVREGGSPSGTGRMSTARTSWRWRSRRAFPPFLPAQPSRAGGAVEMHRNAKVLEDDVPADSMLLFRPQKQSIFDFESLSVYFDTNGKVVAYYFERPS